MFICTQAALAASQADQRETQRRISRLQEATNDLNIIEFVSHTESKAGYSESGGCSGDDRAGLSPEDKSGNGEESTGSQRCLRQLPCMPLVGQQHACMVQYCQSMLIVVVTQE